MVIGIIADSSTAEGFLNNLSEADFKLKNVSVIMSDPKLRDAIAKDTGPFRGITVSTLPTKLAKIGIAAPDAQPYVDAVTNGKVLIAVQAPKGSQQAAAEMFQDVKAELVRTV